MWSVVSGLWTIRGPWTVDRGLSRQHGTHCLADLGG